jgi:HemY protein
VRALPALLVIAALVLAAVLVAERPGAVSLVWLGYRVDTSMGVLLVGVVLLGLFVAFLWGLFRRILRGPRDFARSRRERRRRAGYRALTQGMVAVAAGDPEEAQRQARKADVLLAEPPLTLLLSAQAAQLKGDEDAARKYFTAMLNRPETEFLGLRGLLNQALREGDRKAALRLTERARGLRPKTPWVLASLFDLQAREGQWEDAQRTLAEASRRKAIAADDARRHQAALLFERSREADAEGRPNDAMAHIARAVQLAPDFSAAIRRHAELLQREGRSRPATKAIEAAWRRQPHPELAETYASLVPGEAALARVKRMEKLAAQNPSHHESRLAVANAALEAKLWGEARRQVEPLAVNGSTTARVCRLMAELEEKEKSDHAAARDWLARAAAAPPDPVYVCSSCAAESRLWAALCPACGAFNTLEWRTPSHAAPALEPPAARLAPPAETPHLPAVVPPPSSPIDAPGTRG